MQHCRTLKEEFKILCNICVWFLATSLILICLIPPLKVTHCAPFMCLFYAWITLVQIYKFTIDLDCTQKANVCIETSRFSHLGHSPEPKQ